MIAPMLCQPADRLPVGDDWVYELKYDGARALVALDPHSGRGHVYARDGTDISASFPEIANLEVPEACLLDGELVCWDADGHPDFARLSRRLHSRQAWLVTAIPVCFVAFDVLCVGQKWLTQLPWMQRRVVLASLCPAQADHPHLRKSLRFEDGAALWAAVVHDGLEGVVAKRRASPYQPGKRSADWKKIKAFKEAVVTVDAYEDNPAGITAIRSADNFRVQVASHNGTRLRALLDTGPQPINIQYLEETADGRYRSPTYRGLATIQGG